MIVPDPGGDGVSKCANHTLGCREVSLDHHYGRGRQLLGAAVLSEAYGEQRQGSGDRERHAPETGIELDRKVLAATATDDASQFTLLAAQAKAALAAPAK